MKVSYKGSTLCVLYVVSSAIIFSGCRGLVQGNMPPTPISSHSPNALVAKSLVVLVAFENQKFEKVIGNPHAPYLNGLARQYALAGNFFADTHPSLGNYFMLTLGKTVSNNPLFDQTIYDDNLIRQLGQAGIPWKAYFEGMPQPGYRKDRAFPYVREHNPFSYFSDTVFLPQQANNMVPLTQLASDVANDNLAPFVYVAPGQQDNMHDCPAGMTKCSNDDKLLAGDKWLQENIGPILQTPAFQQNGLLIITWDESWESDARNHGGRIPVTLVGPRVKQNYVSSTFYQHESALRLICEMIGIPNSLGSAQNATSMKEFLK